MKKSFTNAIRGTGGLARPAADVTQAFAASIQPAGFEGDGHSGLGTGFLKSYKLFAEYNAVTQGLREGDIIEFDNRSYRVKSISPAFFGGKPAYLSGTLTLCEGGAL